MRLADRTHHIGDLDAAAQRDVVGGLDDRSVEDGIAVRQADLDHVAPPSSSAALTASMPPSTVGKPAGQVAR